MSLSHSVVCSYNCQPPCLWKALLCLPSIHYFLVFCFFLSSRNPALLPSLHGPLFYYTLLKLMINIHVDRVVIDVGMMEKWKTGRKNQWQTVSKTRRKIEMK